MIEVIVILKILAGSILAPLIFRILGSTGPRERTYRVAGQYLAAALLVSAGIALLGEASWGPGSWKAVAVGAILPFGVFFQWRAYAWNMSLGAIFMASVYGIALFLSAAVLGEWRALANNPLLVVGFAVVCIGVALLARHDVREKVREKGSVIVPPAFYLYALLFVSIFALDTFLQNVWAKDGMTVAEFTFGRYWGGFAGSLGLLLLARVAPAQTGPRTMSVRKEIALVCAAGAAIFGNIFFQFISFQEVEQVVIGPVYVLADLAGPALVGLFFFKEWEKLHGARLAYFLIGLTGAILLTLAR